MSLLAGVAGITPPSASVRGCKDFLNLLNTSEEANEEVKVEMSAWCGVVLAFLLVDSMLLMTCDDCRFLADADRQGVVSIFGTTNCNSCRGRVAALLAIVELLWSVGGAIGVISSDCREFAATLTGVDCFLLIIFSFESFTLVPLASSVCPLAVISRAPACSRDSMDLIGDSLLSVPVCRLHNDCRLVWLDIGGELIVGSDIITVLALEPRNLFLTLDMMDLRRLAVLGCLEVLLLGEKLVEVLIKDISSGATAEATEARLA